MRTLPPPSLARVVISRRETSAWARTAPAIPSAASGARSTTIDSFVAVVDLNEKVPSPLAAIVRVEVGLIV